MESVIQNRSMIYPSLSQQCYFFFLIFSLQTNSAAHITMFILILSHFLLNQQVSGIYVTGFS